MFIRIKTSYPQLSTVVKKAGVWWKITGGYKPIPTEEEQETEELSTGYPIESYIKS